ncbi:hypothetical protein [Halopiger djelfimassiliensis]|uniref:hypothetical protein n=1 Tax=Halopiger djelfimassiliensis TaxID=1293047 RepID=UPI000677ED4F|nr:hypothetical protein [Halopiger djelfimassiliensis]
MERRRFLAAAGVATAGLAGCLSETGDSGNGEADPGNETDNEQSASNETESEHPPDGFAAELAFPSNVVSMQRQLPDEARPNRLTDAAELNETTLAAIETAIDDGRYETDEPADALLEGLFRLSYVEYEGTVYAVEYEMPEYVVSARDVPASEADSAATISWRNERLRALGVDNGEIIGAVHAVLDPGRDGEGGATDTEYRATILEENLAEFLETYSYVVYPGDGDGEPEPNGYVELERDHEDPGPPYTVTVEELDDEDRYGRPVSDVTSYPDPVAETLRAVVRQGKTHYDELPDGFDAVLDDESYVRVDGDVYEPQLRTVDHDDVPVSLSLATVDDAERSFTLEVTTDRADGVQLSSGAPAPFGVLSALAIDRSGSGRGGATLWSDAYDESGHVHVTERDGDRMLEINSIGLTTTLEPDEPLAETYAVRPEWGFEAGTYRLESTLSVRWGTENERSAAYPFVITLSVPDLESEPES